MIDYDIVEDVIYGILLPMVCIPGVVAAALSAIVYARMRRSSLEVLLCGLSVFDVVLLTCTLLIYPAINACGHQEDPMSSSVCHFFWKSALITFPLSVIAQTGSVWTCVAVTVDRFVAVSYPLRRRVWCSSSSSLSLLLFIALFSVLFKVPAFLEVTLNEDGVLVDTPLRKNPTYQAVYGTYLYAAVLVVIPWTAILAFNAVVIHKVHRAQRAHELLTPCSRTARRDDSEKRVTLMCTVMTLIFVLCNVPATALNVVESLAPRLRYSFRPFIPLSNLLVPLNSACNMIIYCLFNRKFRIAVLQLVGHDRQSSGRKSAVSEDVVGLIQSRLQRASTIR